MSIEVLQDMGVPMGHPPGEVRILTLVDKIKEAEARIALARSGRMFLEEQRDLYVSPKDIPAQLTMDIKTYGKTVRFWGSRLGGLRTSQRRS